MKTTLALVALLVLVSISYASACSCMMPGSPVEEMGKSDAVFAGKVTKIDMPVPNDGTGSAKVTLDVSQVWKGQKSKTITVSTATNSAACGFLCESADCTAGFKVGGEYIVYAGDYGGDGALSTTICTRTKLLSEAQEDLAGLGKGYVFSAPKPEDLPVEVGLKCDMPCYALTLIAVIALAAVGGVIYLKKFRGGKAKKK